VRLVEKKRKLGREDLAYSHITSDSLVNKKGENHISGKTQSPAKKKLDMEIKFMSLLVVTTGKMKWDIAPLVFLSAPLLHFMANYYVCSTM